LIYKALRYCFLLSLVLWNFALTAQICNGSLGDPVVNIDFGSGANPGPQLQAKLPNLVYTTNGCPNDGFYTLANSVQNCYSGSWYSYSQDHTPGDVNGYMMLINASLNSGEFYVDTVKGLCSGTTYEFAAWVTNVFNSNPNCPITTTPNLVFSIESVSGQVLATYTTGSIPNGGGGQWKQYGLYFTTTAGSADIILRISNSGEGGCGNDLAIDDITFRPCGPSLDMEIVGTNLDTLHQCADTIRPVTMKSFIGPGFNNPETLWQISTDDGITWNDIAGTKNAQQYMFTPGGISVTYFRIIAAEQGQLGSFNCRIASHPIKVEVHALPVIGATSNAPLCEENVLQLQAAGGNLYSWQGPAGFTSQAANPQLTASLAAAGRYYVTVTTAFGCKGYDSALVTVNPKPQAMVQDSFTVCESMAITLLATGGSVYAWSPAQGLSATNIANPVAIPDTSRSYTVVVSNSFACADTASTFVKVLESPRADAGPDKVVFEGNAVMLNGSATGEPGTTWQWFPNSFMDDNSSLTPMVSPTDDITYKLSVSSPNGCPDYNDDVFVRVFKKVIIPNVFSPNGDGINDTWRIEALVTYPEADVRVFDRYGRNVYQSVGYNSPWDGTSKGKPLPAAAYYYTINLKNGSTPLSGSVTILR